MINNNSMFCKCNYCSNYCSKFDKRNAVNDGKYLAKSYAPHMRNFSLSGEKWIEKSIIYKTNKEE